MVTIVLICSFIAGLLTCHQKLPTSPEPQAREQLDKCPPAKMFGHDKKYQKDNDCR